MISKRTKETIDRYAPYVALTVYFAMVVGGIIVRGTTIGFALTFTGALFIYMEILILRACKKAGKRGGEVAAARWVWSIASVPIILALVGIVCMALANAMQGSANAILFHGGFWLVLVSTLVALVRCFWKSFQEQREKNQAHSSS